MTDVAVPAPLSPDELAARQYASIVASSSGVRGAETAASVMP